MEEVLTLPILPPVEGLDKYTSPHEMEDSRSPNMKNFICFPSYVVTREGYSKIGSNLPLSISSKGDIICYKDARGSSHIIALTDRFAYEYEASTEMWKSITGATTVLEDGEATTNWVAGDDGITLSADTIIYKVGTKSLKITNGYFSSSLVTNGTFDTNLSSWSVDGGTVEWDAGEASFTGTGGRISQVIAWPLGASCRVDFDISAISGTGFCYAGLVLLGSPDATGHFSYTFTGGAINYIAIGVSGGTAKFDNVTVRYVTSTIPANTILAYNASKSVDITGKLNAVSFWFYSTQEDLQLKIKLTGASYDKTYYHTLNHVAANTWYFVICYVSGNVDTTTTRIDILNSVIMTGNVYIDDIRASETLPFSGDRWATCDAHDAALGVDNGGKVLVLSNEENGATDIGVRYYQGHSGDYIKSMTLDPATTEAVKELCEFWNHLLLANYSESSLFNVNKFKYSDIGDIDDFAAGTYGVRTLTDIVGEVIRIVKLGYSAFIFATDSIASLQYIGGINVFSTPTETPEIGLFSCKSIVVKQNNCYFLGTNKTIQVISNSNISSIGLLVEDFLFNELNHASKETTLIFSDVISHRIFIVYPTVDGYNRKYISFDYRTNDKFERGAFSNDIIDATTAAITTTYYCDSPIFAGIYCDEKSGFCDDYTSNTGKDITLLLSKDGYVYSFSNNSLLDDATIISDCFIETPDIYRRSMVDKNNYSSIKLSGEYLDRFIEVVLRFKNLIGTSSINVYYSYDDYIDDVNIDNTTWFEFTLSPITVTTTWTRFVLPLDVRARRIRIRFSCSASNKTYYLGGCVKLVPGVTR